MFMFDIILIILFRTKFVIMNKFALTIFLTMFSLTVFTQTNNVNIQIFSSGSGYAVIPDGIIITNNTTKAPVSFNSNRLPDGDYILQITKQGYSGFESYFSVNRNDINIRIFLDPVSKDPLLTSSRIKQLVKKDYSLILGYAVDDITGNPLGSVSVKDGKTNIAAATNSHGYFEFYLPSKCDIKTTADITFNLPGYNAEEFTRFETTPETDFIFTVRMKKNTSFRLRGEQLPLISNETAVCDDCTSSPFLNPAVTGFVVPLNIRVGRNCTGTNCTTTEIYTLETYCKYVLPAEIYSCWGNLSGGMNSLQACAVAVRSYGVYFVYNPISSQYDICDNTYCQYFGSTTSTNTNNAVDNTYRNILVNTSGVVRSEYSAENNNSGCGNGYSGTGSSWPCISDPVCLNRTQNGHGRGLCQWGTIRWATGTLVSASSPCNLGIAHTYGTLTWQQILEHYYNVSPYNWTVYAGITATINTSVCVPSASNPCSTFTITSNVNSTGAASFMIGASIAPAGTTNWISDPAHDVKLAFSLGTGNYNRLFTIPCNAAPGYYDLLTAIWYDKNNNNLIDGSDFVVHSKLTPNAINISPIGINIISNEIPKEFNLFHNFPNPFNPSTQIKFDIPKTSYVILKIFDITGKESANLVNEELKAGKYSVDWNASDLPSGVYFYKIKSGNFTATKKMILLK